MAEKNLYKELAARILLPGSKRIANLFRMAANEEEAGLMLNLPGALDEITEKSGQKKEKIRAMLDSLYLRGLVFYSEKPKGKVFRMARHFIEFHDPTIVWAGATQEYLDAWQEYVENEWIEVANTIEDLGLKPGLRVIPVERSIKIGTKILPHESAKNFILNAANHAVNDCVCRKTANKCGSPLDVCIQLNKAADYAIERGVGRAISKEEALRILDQCEKDGFVHTTENKVGMGPVICNCCEDCCRVMPMLIKHGKHMVAPSRFGATINRDDCTGCRDCLERCMFGAIFMEGKTAEVLEDKCMGCGLCSSECTADAITLREIRTETFIPEKSIIR